MRVLQINSVCGIGSTGRIAADIDKILKEKGHESFVAYGRDKSRNCDSTIRVGNHLDNYIHAVKTRVFDKHGFGSKTATKIFISKIEKLNPDIIHLHNLHGYYLNIEILFNYLKQIEKPVVWTLHDCWAFTGHCSHFDYADCYKWEKGCFDCPQKRYYPSSLFMDNSKDNYRRKKAMFTGVKNLTIVTPSKWLAGIVKKSFLREYPVLVINNGIDLETFKPIQNDLRQKYNIDNKFIILGIANVWNERKGYEYFIELSKKLSPDEIIVMIGLKKSQIKKLPDKIIGIAKTHSAKELAEIYSAADVFVNPTLEDNFPTTNLEAMACGLPIITFNTGGSGESVEKDCGIIVEKGNAEELLKAVRIVKTKGKSSFSAKCIHSAVSSYDKNQKFNEYIALYKEMLK